MARPQSVMDLMHVPTPDVVMRCIRKSFCIGHEHAVLDPCCGTGEAVQQIYDRANYQQGVPKIYGVELDANRSAIARGNLESVLTGPIQQAKISHRSFSLVFLNPPYADSTAGRLEQVFLERCHEYLVDGGILVLIVKQESYVFLKNFLCRYYDVEAHWRFPDPYYDGPELAFTQTLLIARKRRLPAVSRDPKEYWEKNLGLARPLDELDASGSDRYIPVPNAPGPDLFWTGALSEQDLANLLRDSPVPRLRPPKTASHARRPPLPLKQGHVSLVLASGLINGVYGSPDDGTLHVAKGTIVRTVKVTKELDTTVNGNPAVNEKTLHSFAICIRGLRPSGVIANLSKTIVSEAE